MAHRCNRTHCLVTTYMHRKILGIKFANSIQIPPTVKHYAKCCKLDFIVDPNIIWATSLLNVARNHGKNQRLPITTPLQKSIKIVKFWTKHRKTLDGTTGMIVSVTNRTSASAYVLCHLTLLLSLFQKYRMEISNSLEEEIQETTTRKEWEKLSWF